MMKSLGGLYFPPPRWDVGVQHKKFLKNGIMSSAARWRSGNAAVCKTVMRGFNSPTRLTCALSSSAERFPDLPAVVQNGSLVQR